MAKKAGSEDAAAAPSSRSNAPPAGHNLTPESFLTAVRDISALKAVAKQANENLKAARKRHKANGVELGILDSVMRMTEWSRGEARDYFATESRYRELMGLPVVQMDMFKNTPDLEVERIEWEAHGRTAGIMGKPARPPEECPKEHHQYWLRGHASADESNFDEVENGSADDDDEEDVRPRHLVEKDLERKAQEANEEAEESLKGNDELETQLDKALAASDAQDDLAKARKARAGKVVH